MQSVIIGTGITAQGVAHFLTRQGLPFVFYDTRGDAAYQTLPEAWRTRVWSSWPRVWPDDHRCILAPGMFGTAWWHREAMIIPEQARLSDVDLFMMSCPEGTNVWAVTGTNGKSTVTTLTAHLLQSAGYSVLAGGNLGRSCLDLLETPAQGYVLELSSFQLALLRKAHFHAGILLNLTSDHLDRHGSMAHYRASKMRLATMCTRFFSDKEHAGEDYMQADDRVSWSPQGLLWQGQPWIAKEALPTLLQLYPENLFAALALLSDRAISQESLTRGLSTYQPLAHRVERYQDDTGCVWINDSKATNIGSATASLQACLRQGFHAITWLVGGDSKGLAQEAWQALCLPDNVTVIAFGRDGQSIAEALAGKGKVHVVTTLDEARACIKPAAQHCVLLAPACASWDQYRDYQERGAHFRRLAGFA